jgi:hypothetical protein
MTGVRAEEQAEVAAARVRERRHEQVRHGGGDDEARQDQPAAAQTPATPAAESWRTGRGTALCSGQVSVTAGSGAGGANVLMGRDLLRGFGVSPR